MAGTSAAVALKVEVKTEAEIDEQKRKKALELFGDVLEG